MSVIRIASRYAKSLIDVALEKNQLEEVYQDVQTFLEVYQKPRTSILCLKAPIIKGDKKAKIFNAIFAQKLGATTMAFFNIVLRKHREIYLVDIAREFIVQYKTIKHISSVRLTTATPISDQLTAEIKERMRQRPTDR